MAVSTTKPTVFIVTGAWHPASAYRLLVTHLENHGYFTDVVSLPSLNPSNPETATCAEDAQGVRERLLTLIDEEGKDVVVIAHSYGGVPAGGAAHGLAKASRSRDGKAGGVVGMIYLCAHIFPEGSTIMGFSGGKHAPFVNLDQPSKGLMTASPIIESFYHDVDPELAESLAKSLLPHAALPFESPVPAQAWAEPVLEGKLAYLRCTQDRAIPVAIQDRCMQLSQVKWTIKDIDSSHTPWASKPEETARAIEGFIAAF